MGLFIHLYINPQRIDPQQWQAVYEESLTILQEFPAALIRLAIQERLGQKFYMYTPDLIVDPGSQAESWQISGDAESRRTGESARLYRYVSHWLEDRRVTENDLDILWATEETIEYVSGNGFDCFGGKTQGYPFHLALLAVGILVESRFPQAAFVVGDIDRGQVEQMLGWLEHDLALDVSCPVCVDGERLYQRLAALYQTPALAIKRFKSLFRGSNAELWRHLLHQAPRQAVIDTLKETLGYYSSLKQLGAADLLTQFLGVTKNPEALIELVQAISHTKPDNTEFTLSALLQMLGKRFITIDYPERKSLSLVTPSGENLMTIEDAFSQVFMRLRGMPTTVDYYCDAATLLDIFARYEPQHRADFQQIIETTEQACRATIKEIEDQLGRMAETTLPEQSVEERMKTQVEAAPPAPDTPAPPGSVYTEYILNQVASQKQTFKNPEQSATAMGKSLQNIFQTHADRFESTERDDYLQEIYYGSYQHGIILLESAWQAIEHKADLETLKYLMALALIPDRELSFFRWRSHIMETPALWPYLTGRFAVD